MAMVNRSAVSVDDLLAHADWLRGLVRDLVSDRHRAEDVVQETWLRAVRNPPAKRGAVRTWLARVARNVSRDRWRADSRRESRETETASPEAERPTVARARLHRSIVDAVLELPEPGRTTVLLRYFDGLTPKEIAERSGVPAATVRSRLHRAVADLRERFDQQDQYWRSALLPLLALTTRPRPAAGLLAAAAGGVVLVGAVTGAVLVSLPAARAPAPPALAVAPDGAAAAPAPDEPESEPRSATAETAPVTAEKATTAAKPAAHPAPELAALAVLLKLDTTCIDLKVEGIPCREAVEKLLAPTGVRLEVAAGGEKALSAPVNLNFDETPAWQALEFIGNFANMALWITADGVRVGPAQEGWWPSKAREAVVAAAGRALDAEMRFRAAAEAPGGIDGKPVRVSAAKTLGELARALESQGVPVRIGDGLADVRCARLLPAGTVLEVLRAAGGDRARPVLGRRGLALLRPADAAAVERDVRDLRDARARLAAVDVAAEPDPCPVEKLGERVSGASGIPVRVLWSGPRYARQPGVIETGPGLSCRDALDRIPEEFPALGWTVVAGEVIVFPRATAGK